MVGLSRHDQHLRNTDLGIQSEKLLTFETPLFRHQDFDRRVAFVNAELESIRALPGVLHAGAISRIPLTVNDQATFYLLAGQSLAGQSRAGRVLSCGDWRLLPDHRRAPARRPLL